LGGQHGQGLGLRMLKSTVRIHQRRSVEKECLLFSTPFLAFILSVLQTERLPLPCRQFLPLVQNLVQIACD
jgi:hypothetical protein